MSNYDESVKAAGLNRSQRRFCKLPVNSNVRLLAPAGSGKTFSLLWRCRYITNQANEKGFTDPHFLLVAFTRSAKLEIEHRLKNDPIFIDVHATVRTLNAWGWEQIRRPGKELLDTSKKRRNAFLHDLLPIIQEFKGIAACIKDPSHKYSNAASIMDLLDLLKAMGFTHSMNKSAFNSQIRHLKEVRLYPILERGFETLYSIEGIQAETAKTKSSAVSEFFSFWKKAVIRLEAVNRYTMEDQKYWARQHLERQILEGKRPQGVTRYTHVFVDEFQDINPLDLELLKSICRYNGQSEKPLAITIVGDDDQAIFGWRGTTPEYILHPEKYFGVSFTTCILDTNYRSPKNIVKISNQLLFNNKEREPKTMRSAAEGRAVIKLLNRKKYASSVDTTMKLIWTLLQNERYKHIALIGRRQVSLFPYQVLLSSEGVKYHVDSDINIFDGELIQSLQNIIKIVYRAKDNDVDDASEAVLTICDKIKHFPLQNKERLAISEYLDKNSSCFSEALAALRSYPEQIKGQIPADVCDIIDELVRSETVYEFMKSAEENLLGLSKDYLKADIDNHYKDPQLFRLGEVSKRYAADFRQFYRDLEKARKENERSSIRAAADTEEGYMEIDSIPIYLLTATRAKGHEFDAVIILDANDDEWPNHLSDDIEEERRLFYVAVSRARKMLCFVIDGEHKASRFLQECGLA